VHAVEW